MKWSHRRRYVEPSQRGLLLFYYQQLERDQEKILKDDSSLTHCHGISKQCTFHPVGTNSSVPLVTVASLQRIQLSQWLIKNRTVISCTDPAFGSCEMM